MTQWQWFTVAFVASISSVPVSYCISLLIGFPVPFSLVVNASIGYPMMIGLLWLFWHKTVRDNPHLKANLYRQVLVPMGQMMMMFAFPLYFFFFKLLPPLGQSVFTVLIPIIKLGIKNYFNVTLKDVDDIKAAFVVFNIDLFSALYVANCLQASQSKTNLAIVMAVDVAQPAVAMYELRRVMMQIRSLVRLNEFNGTLLDLCTVISGKPAAQAEPKSSVRPSRVHAVSAPPEDPPVPTVDRSLTVPDLKPGDATLLLPKIGAVLYMVEFYLLIEFAEVMIPIVYCIYMIVMSNLPNRAYYSQLTALTNEEMLQSITTVILNAGLEMVSFIVILWLIHRTIQLPTPHLLAFALEKEPVASSPGLSSGFSISSSSPWIIQPMVVIILQSPASSAMWVRRVVFAVFAAVFVSLPSVDAKRECRHPNYIARDGKILAVDPANPTVETEISIKGVAWSGMEKPEMIPDGLGGTEEVNARSIANTKVSTLLEFLSNNTFNSVRLPLNAQYVIHDTIPQLAYIHGYENRELTTWPDPNNVKYFDLIGRVVQTLQDNKITVLLDIHLIDKYDKDVYWYTPPFVNVTESPTYKAVSYLASALCNATFWNIIGVDLKDAMLDAQWNAKDEDADEKSDWKSAAEVLANRVVDLCPQWLVFVGGAASPTDAQRFKVSDDYKASEHWSGGNLKNATTRPMKMAVENKLVYAPQVHAHGRFPQNYFFTADSNCSANAIDELGLERDGAQEECVDFVDGKKIKSKIGCNPQGFGCVKYKHLEKTELVANYKKVLNEGLGNVVAQKDIPVVFGSFSGVYGADIQPHQTAVLDYLIEYAAQNTRGGYFWALNPDTEQYLEDSVDGKTGSFGRTHYGLFKPTSWQEPHKDLLEALSKVPSSTIPCYGESSAITLPGIGLLWTLVLAVLWTLA
ncbi:hypothetical protein Poli38472_011719 [Pythium oligandrum]|uniref:Glycoside hydrolase family 5 domain-containing protein n=1 Tax=Pythium oligandrum TaxID=41045 RepID=A0A8K1C7L3_PYTOL|nr:hypothetical protein Poli38472_011719 [Pythium oligandrum]|eukprot:TMW58131.1 hypothetical protein Poli38472_011719 [Pythium oligandrum]